MNKDGIIIGVMLFVLMPMLSAEIEIDVQDSFGLGETASFNYSIIPDIDSEISYYVSAYCPNAPTPIFEIETTDSNVTGSYTVFTIDESIEPQTCTASVVIIEPYNLTEYASFEIVTDPSFSFYLYLCKDQLCSEKTKFFVVDEDIYLKYYSEVSDPVMNATLGYPNGTSQEISLPYSMKAEQSGSYTLEVTASKEGYKNASASISFAVIERHANITDASECNADGTCDPEETYQTCPQDCASGQLDGICDLVEDGICDPDCNETRDEDCRIDYQVEMDEGWNLVSFPLERLEGMIPPPALILPLFLVLGILVWRHI